MIFETYGNLLGFLFKKTAAFLDFLGFTKEKILKKVEKYSDIFSENCGQNWKNSN